MNKRATALAELLPFAQALIELEPDLKRLDKIEAEEAGAKARIDALEKTANNWNKRIDERRELVRSEVEAHAANIKALQEQASTILSTARASAETIKQTARDEARDIKDTAQRNAQAKLDEQAQARAAADKDLQKVKDGIRAATGTLNGINDEIRLRQAVLDEAKSKLAALGA